LKIYYLVTLSVTPGKVLINEKTLKCAVEVDFRKMPNSANVYYSTPANQEYWKKHLPPEIKNLGPVIDIEEIYAIIPAKVEVE